MNTIEKFLEGWLVDMGRVFQADRVFLMILFIAGIISVTLSNTGAIPVTLSYFLFYLALLVLFSLYRPERVWQLLVFFLPFELLSVAIFANGLDIRAYQFAVIGLGLATAVLCLQKKVIIPPLRWFDGALALLLAGGVLTFFLRGLPLSSGKDLLIIFSFAVLYGLGRLYLRTKKDIHTFLHTLLVSGVVIAGYALYQMIAFQNGQAHFMVMDGRPNSMLEEADWLGFFIGLAALIALVRALQAKRWFEEALFGLLLLLFTIVLVLTVSRSAWLGAVLGVATLGLLLAFDYLSGFIHTRLKDFRIFFKFFIGVPVIFGVALGVISFFSLTRFELGERFTSTGTGEQSITIACEKNAHPPQTIQDTQELASFGCQHINLEEQKNYQDQGFIIKSVERPDPNIHIRADLYRQTADLLKEHFFLGLGWGESVKILGKDSRGAGLNSSNLFLEVWLGSGIIGLLGFLAFWFGTLFAIVRRIHHKREMTEGFWFSVLLLILWVQVSVFNFFNAGILSGVFLIVLMLAAWYDEKTVPYSLPSLWRK